MRCSICDRPLLHCAVPGIAIGPICAMKRGLLPEREREQRASNTTRIPRATLHDGQVDWVNLINAGLLAAEARGGL